MSSQPPTPPSSPDPHELVDRLADGTLDVHGRARLALAMEHDPSLRRDADELESVNRQLKAFFGPVTAAAADTIPISKAATASKPARRTALMLAAAACLLIGGVVLGVFLSTNTPAWGAPAREIYQRIEAANFTPREVCTTPEQFARWTGDNLGEPLTPQLGVPGLELLGWNRAELFSAYTGVLITKVDGTGVIVLLDRDTPEIAEPVYTLGGGLKAFHAQLGRIRAVEITPLAEPRVLPTLKPAGP